jgi:hypothetical protein
MNITSAHVTAAALALATAVLSGCAAGASGEVPRSRVDNASSITERATPYVGDPWEKRYKKQFWADQHIHDSWNPCHIGENVPKRLQGSGAACWSRLDSHTVR